MHLHQVPADLQETGDSIQPDAAASEAAGHEEVPGGLHGAHAGDTALDGTSAEASTPQAATDKHRQQQQQ